MTDTRDSARRVDFPEAGDGCYLLLRNSGFRKLRSIYEQGHIAKVEEAFVLLDIDVIDRLLGMMVWNDDTHIVKSFDDFDNLTVGDLVEKIRDAWSLSLNGRRYLDQVQHVREQLLKEQQKQDAESPLVETATSGSI